MMALDPRIPLMAEGIPMEPRMNALMRAGQMQGMQQQNAMREMQMQQLRQAMAAEQEQRKRQEAQQQEMQGYLASLSGRAGPPQQFNPVEALQRFGPETAKTLQGFFEQKPRKLTTVSPGAALVDEATGQPVFTAPSAEPKAPSAVQEYEFAKQQGYKGTFQQWKLDNARAGATNVTVPIGDKGYAGAMADLMAKQDAGLIDAARGAGGRIRSSQDVKRILKTEKPITGTAADWRLEATKALSTAGIIDGKSVTSTEDLASLLAAQTLDAIKTSGLGSGQGFTDKDRQFLQDARAGRINLNADTLYRLADMNERAARDSIKAGKKVAERLKKTPSLGGFVQDLEFEEPPAINLPTAADIAAEAERRRKARGGN